MNFPELHTIEKVMAMLIDNAFSAGTVFSAALIDINGQILIKDVNTTKTKGPLAHAEFNVLNAAVTDKIQIQDTFLISTCEPCPLCMGGAIWAKVPAVYWGLDIDTLKSFYDQIEISSKEIREKSHFKPHIKGNIMRDEVLELVNRLTKRS